jgi:hypothetical protein
MSANREILMKFITGQVQKTRQDVSMQGYKDDSPYKDNPFNTIYGTPEGTSITMEGVSTPLIGIDEFGNRQEMVPGEEYFFPGSRVKETRMQNGGQNLYNVSMNNPMIIPSQGMNPVGYYDTLPKNEAGIPYDKDGTLFTQSKMVSRFDENGKPLSAAQVRENQKMWNMQKIAYSPEQQTFNIWKNNPQNTEQGFYNTKEYSKYLKKITPTGKDVGLDGLCDPNFSSTKCGTSKQHAKEDKKEWSKKQEGGEADFNKVKEWYNNYIDSPLYKRNLQNSGYIDVDKVIEQRKSNIGKTEYVYDENRLGTYYQPNTNVVHHAPKKDSEIWSKEYESVLPQDTVLAHELGHSVLDNSKTFFGRQTPGYNRYDYEQLQSRNKDRKISRGANENYADQKALQYEAAKLGIYKPGFEEFTKEHLDKLPVDIKDRALQNYSEEDLIWLMNNIAQNNDNSNDQLAIAQIGGATRADSLAVYNNTRAIEDYYKKQGYIKERVKDSEKHKENIKHRKEWINDAKKYLKEAKNAPVHTFYTQQDKNKNIAENKKNLKKAEQWLSEVNDKVDPKKYLKRLEESKISFEKRPKDSGRYVDEQNNLVEEKPSIEKFHLPVDENKFYQREQSAGFLDLRSPMPLYDKRIVPQYLSELKSPDLILQDQIADKMHKARTEKERDAFAKQYADLIYADNVEMYEYEPLAVMPFDMVPPELQRERVEKYGLSGVPKSIIDAHPEWLENTNQPAKTQTLQPRVEALNLRPIEQTPINIPVQELDFNTPIKAPKSYNVSALRYNMKGPSDYYNYNQEGVDYETAMQIKAASDAYNRDIEKRYGPQNEYRTPKLAADAAERLKQLRSEFEITPNYQTGGEKKWLGNTLDKNGYITSATKGGNYISFTGNQRADEWINKQIDSGKFGFDPTTGGTFPLKKPVKGLSKEDQFMATKQYYELRAPEGFTSESQQAQIEKLPEWQQDMLNAENEKRRKKVVYNNMQEVVKNPLFYAPGAIALAPIAAAGLTEAGILAAPYIEGALATQLPGLASVPGATVGNAINAGFASHGLMHVGPDAVKMVKDPSLENAGNLAMDALEIAPVVGPAGRMIGGGYKSLKNIKTSIDPELKQGLQTNGFFDMFKSKKPITTSVENLNQTIVSKPWEMQELPGLHLKSTMEGEAISKIVEPKTGLINTEQALSIIGKESGGADKVALIKQGLGENIPKKMDYNDFRKVVQNQLIPLETNLAEHSSNYGLSNIGYPSPKRSSYDSAITFATQDVKNITNKIKDFESKGFVGNPDSEVPMFLQRADYESNLSELYQRLGESKAQLAKNQESLKNLPLENKTIIFGNKEKFGKGSNAHHNSDETLGHAHYLIDAETPDVLTITQLQSDAFQGTHRIMPKTFKPEIAQYQLTRMQEIQQKNIATLNKMKAEGAADYEIKQMQEIVDAQELQNALQKGHVENFAQKSLLDKNHQERYLQEIVNHAAQRGDVNKVRLPTSETAANVQSYATIRKYTDEQQTLFNKISKEKEAIIDNSLDSKGFIDYKKAESNPRYIELTKEQEKLQAGVKMDYDDTSKTILKKYEEQPKLIKKLFGQDVKVVTDSKGNTWYEFDIPESFKQGKGQIKAFLKGGETDFEKYANKQMRYDIGGTTVAEQYTQITGKPWHTARAEGLTDGSARQNLALIKKLKENQQVVEAPKTVPPPVNVVNTSDKTGHTKEMAQRVVQLAEERIKNNRYIDVPEDIKKVAFERGEGAYGCIGGVCTIYKEAGVMNNVDWSNTHFAEKAKDYGFTANKGWGLKGIQNLEPGDMLMTNQRKNEQGNYYPSHSQIYLGKTKSGQLRFFDNFWKTERTYFEDEIKERLDPARKKTEVSATIYKVNPYDDSNPMGLTPEELQKYNDKKEFIEKESKSKQSYVWKVSEKAKNYNDTTKRVIDSFIEYANDNDKINDLVKKTGKSKEEIHDSLLNVFGELGAENNWTTSKGKGVGSFFENVAESVVTAFGGGKKLSVGPGQIKYQFIPKDLKEKFDIQSPNDLYDLDKVLPLMTAMDLRDKQVLEKWGENNVLSQKLFGWTRPEVVQPDGTVTGGFKADQLYTETDGSRLNNGVGRYSPYLRNQYSSINSGLTYINGDDWVPFNEGTMTNFSEARFNESGEDEMKIKYQRDQGSYPYKVEQNWRDNLNRTMYTTQPSGSPEELDVVVIEAIRKKKSEMGGMLYANKDAGLSHEQSMTKYLSDQNNLLDFMKRVKVVGGPVPFDEYYRENIINPRNKL